MSATANVPVSTPVGAPGLTQASAVAGRGRQAGQVSLWRDYLTLTKPRIMSLLVLTATCAMVAAAGGAPGAVPLLGLVLGGALACGGAGALNHVLDRDIDRLMGPRTSGRPVASGRITPLRATAFGLALSGAAFLILATMANPLAAVLAISGGLYYVVVYTAWLKRANSQNIVIGGGAGAMPVLAGWAAAHGGLSLGALLLFAIVLAWTPPHFWALALLLERHYAAAGVPMLPVVRGSDVTVRQIVLYTVILLGVSLVPAITGTFGVLYLVGALLLGLIFLLLALRLWRLRTPACAGVLFHYSLLYLALLFVLVAADAVIG